ncbi:MAG: hypothetical protein ACI9LM_003882 [Alteromonadaceae bacterium]|jgi:hypothetical protein
MSLLKNSRKLHKWLMLFLGVQFVIWTVSGAYMVIFDIDYIHGDSLVVNHQKKINSNDINFTLGELLKKYPDAENIEMGVFIDQGVYRFMVKSNTSADTSNNASKNEKKTQYLVSAKNGQQLSPLNEDIARRAAQHYYSGEGDINEIELITDNPPFELSQRLLPAWRVNFNDFGSPSLYVSAQSGKLVTKRHEFWRFFDLMFSLHVMDYEDEDPSNQLLFWFVLFSLIAALFGFILTYFRIFKSEKSINQQSTTSEKGLS